MNGKVGVKVIGANNGDGLSSIQNLSRIELDNKTQQWNDSSGAYVNSIMLNGSAYNSPNLANNRRDNLVHEQTAQGDGTLSNPDVIPSESFSSINENSMGFKGDDFSQNNQSKSNPGSLQFVFLYSCSLKKYLGVLLHILRHYYYTVFCKLTKK